MSIRQVSAAWFSVLVSLTAIGQAGEKPIVEIPTFKVDPTWPKVPPTMLMGDVSGVAVDSHDNVWIINRPKTVHPQGVMAESNPPEAECCVKAPPVMEFDSAGNYIKGWGGPGPGYDWPYF